MKVFGVTSRLTPLILSMATLQVNPVVQVVQIGRHAEHSAFPSAGTGAVVNVPSEHAE